MTSKEALKEFYYCDTDDVIDKSKILYEVLKKDLDRLEKLEKAIEFLKTRIKIETYHEPKSRYYYLYIGGRVVLLSREEYELLKEVFYNGL